MPGTQRRLRFPNVQIEKIWRVKLRKQEIDHEKVQGVVEIHDEIHHQQLEDDKRVQEHLKVVIGDAKSTFERQNVENGNRDELENPIDAESEPGPLEMQAEQNEEIVATRRNPFRRAKVDHRQREQFQKKRFIRKGQILKKSRI